MLQGLITTEIAFGKSHASLEGSRTRSQEAATPAEQL
jgi:hypothetical protein